MEAVLLIFDFVISTHSTQVPYLLWKMYVPLTSSESFKTISFIFLARDFLMKSGTEANRTDPFVRMFCPSRRELISPGGG